MLNRLCTYFVLLVGVAFLVYGCANIGSLEGGKKDITPPELVGSKPAERTINFTGKRVTISFNEFVQLKDISKNFVISPPMKKAPVIIQKPKDIVVNFEEDFLPNTTYTLYFGNSIVDYNEGNPFRNYNFVFSTGNHIDSLSYLGRIYNAFDLTPPKDGMFVMLYPLNHDSVPRKMLPAFITKSNDKGWFKFDNIYADTFLVFGLKDANMNYLFDQPGETIAFSDSLVIIDTSFFELPDTIKPKIVLNDSISPDSIDDYAGKQPQIELYYFKEEVNRNQNLNDFKRVKNNLFTLIFEKPVTDDSLFIELLGKSEFKKWFLKDINLVNDTMDFWITDTTIVKMDTLKLRVGYYTLDSMSHIYLSYDTISLNLKQSPAARNKKGPKPPVFSKVSLQTVVSSNTILELNSSFNIDSDQPIGSFNRKKMLLYKMEDSLKIPVKFTLQKDSILSRRYFLNFVYEPDFDYELVLDTASFTSIYGIDNDSVGYRFKTRPEDYYSTIKVTVKDSKGPTLIQLITPKGELIKQQKVSSDGLVSFEYVAPGKYGLKIIYDKNDNGIWDTGNWRRKLQPEKVLYYNGEISIRSDFDAEITWELLQK